MSIPLVVVRSEQSIIVRQHGIEVGKRNMIRGHVGPKPIIGCRYVGARRWRWNDCADDYSDTSVSGLGDHRDPVVFHIFRSESGAQTVGTSPDNNDIRLKVDDVGLKARQHLRRGVSSDSLVYSRILRKRCLDTGSAPTAAQHRVAYKYHPKRWTKRHGGARLFSASRSSSNEVIVYCLRWSDSLVPARGDFSESIDGHRCGVRCCPADDCRFSGMNRC